MKISLKEQVPKEVRKNLEDYDDFVAHLLYHRGITTSKDAKIFLQPDFERDLHDPFLMSGMEKAVDRILEAIEKKEKIIVWSDYDTDGIPGGVLMHDLFAKIGANFENYIPHRHNEGYGLNIPAIEKLAEGGANLLISVDSGITDVTQVERANELGLDVIITDHHLPQKTLPPALVILNPKLKDQTYPFKDLCGCGVAFKLAQALLKKGDFDIPEGWEKWLLDMAGIATVSDMVPLTGENRALAYFGLVVLRKSPRPGLQQLLRKIRVNQRTITEDDIGFMIGPRINAASRMGEPMQAFEMLSTKSVGEGAQHAADLERINASRKVAVTKITKEIKKKISTKSMDSPVIVMGNPHWRPSLLGLVANSLAEEYERPVFLWGKEGNGLIKGSCRTGADVNLVDLMAQAPEVFDGFGGHAAAGGFSIREEAIHTIEESLSAALLKLPKNKTQKNFEADLELEIDQVNKELLAKISKLAPFGVENKKPEFLFKNITPSSVIWFGKGKAHLKAMFETKSGTVEAIAFFAKRDLGADAKKLVEGEKISLLAAVEYDSYKHVPRLRIIKVLT
ncbi:single-stranded-DNA-specific exonuclease RecJ [Candidatus Wolfebacteria bacterium]|nr:single-stranded-DNA-specific exonuclease RecJ [Candidatus Wolfebacteria bacterium]